MIRVNLLPKEERGLSQRKVNWLRMGAFGAGALTLLVALFAAYNLVLIQMHQNQLDGLQAEVMQLRRIESELRSAQARNRELEEEISFVRSFAVGDSNLRTLSVIQSVVGSMPEQMWLAHLYITPGSTASARGFAVDSAELTRFLEAARGFRQVDSVELESMTRRGERPHLVREFRIRMQLNGASL